jgi:hypothetical protein
MHSALGNQADKKTPSCPQTHKKRDSKHNIIVKISLQKKILITSSQNILSKHLPKIFS